MAGNPETFTLRKVAMSRRTPEHTSDRPTEESADPTVSYALRDARARRRRTEVLVSLLARREDLRGAYAPADYLDEGVRWGA